MGKKYEAKTPAVLAFLKWLDESPYLQHLSWYSRFSNVMALWFAAVTRNDPEYLKLVEVLTPAAVRGCKEPGPGTPDSACGHFAKLWYEMVTEPRDLLGEAYQAYSVRDTARLAQYFTPDVVAKAMAQMTVGDVSRSAFEKDEGLRILEPACGSGVMMIHALGAVFDKHGHEALLRTQAVLVDIDLLCVQMAGIQMAWLPHHIGQVVLMHGDSLTNEQKVVGVLGPGVPAFRPTHERIVVKPEPEARVVIKEDKDAR